MQSQPARPNFQSAMRRVVADAMANPAQIDRLMAYVASLQRTPLTNVNRKALKNAYWKLDALKISRMTRQQSPQMMQRLSAQPRVNARLSAQPPRQNVRAPLAPARNNRRRFMGVTMPTVRTATGVLGSLFRRRR